MNLKTSLKKMLPKPRFLIVAVGIKETRIQDRSFVGLRSDKAWPLDHLPH